MTELPPRIAKVLVMSWSATLQCIDAHAEGGMASPASTSPSVQALGTWSQKDARQHHLNNATSRRVPGPVWRARNVAEYRTCAMMSHHHSPSVTARAAADTRPFRPRVRLRCSCSFLEMADSLFVYRCCFASLARYTIAPLPPYPKGAPNKSTQRGERVTVRDLR